MIVTTQFVYSLV